MNSPQHGSSLAPVPKVAAGGIAAAVAVIVVWVLEFWIDVPPEVAAAVTAIAGFAAGYIKTDS